MPVIVIRVGVACSWSCALTASTRPATRVSNGSKTDKFTFSLLRRDVVPGAVR